MSDPTRVTVSVVPGLPQSFAWWPEEGHLAVDVVSTDELPGMLHAAADHITNVAEEADSPAQDGLAASRSVPVHPQGRSGHPGRSAVADVAELLAGRTVQYGAVFVSVAPDGAITVSAYGKSSTFATLDDLGAALAALDVGSSGRPE